MNTRVTRGGSRVADAIHGNPVTFGGLDINGWVTTAPSAVTESFPVYVDQENHRPGADTALAAANPALMSTLGAVARSKMTQSRAPLSSLGQENLPPTYASTMAVKACGVSSRAPLAALQPQQTVTKCTSIVSNKWSAPFPIYSDCNDENAAVHDRKSANQRSAFGPLVVSVDHQQHQQQQRKQKLRQRPLQELQNGKRPSLRGRNQLESTSWQLAPVNQELLLPPSAASGASNTPTGSLHSSFENALLIGSGSGGLLNSNLPTAVSDVAGSKPQRAVLSGGDGVCAVPTVGTAPPPHYTVSHTPCSNNSAGRVSDIFSFKEYAADVYKVMRDSELRHRAKVGFMSRQPDITLAMRAILVDWLVEVNDEYKMTSETLHLAVNYIDRFLSVMSVVRGKLQLVGTTALFIAAKFEEIYPPTAVEFVYITDDTYTVSQLKKMEHVMLKMLAFDVSVPTSHWFLNFFMCHGGHCWSDSVKHLAQYLIELCLVQYEVHNRYLCSQQAAAALSLSLQMNDQPAWSAQLAAVTGYGVADIRACAEEMLVVLQMAQCQPQQALIDKFGHDKYSRVSSVQPPANCRWS